MFTNILILNDDHYPNNDATIKPMFHPYRRIVVCILRLLIYFYLIYYKYQRLAKAISAVYLTKKFRIVYQRLLASEDTVPKIEIKTCF